MRPERLRECLDALGWSARHLAALTCRQNTTVRRWLRGAAIPPEIAEWLESRVRAAERTPPPRKDAAA
jgi:transcriptional regulator with XRE-family HTH domain